MAVYSFIIDDVVDVKITITDLGDDLRITAEVLGSGSLADLRGLFFNVDDSIDPSGLSATGDDITNQGHNTKNLGLGNNMNGKAKANFDFGVSIGHPGLKGGADDIQFTEFTLSHSTHSLSIDDLAGELFGVRLTSVESVVSETCTPRQIDFRSFEPGDTIDQIIFSDVAVDIHAERNGSPAGNDAMAFDSENPTGGDTDLQTSDQGNVLIISEDGDSSDPDDALQGGTIVFDFSTGVDLKSIKVLDIDETGGSITDNNGNMLVLMDMGDGSIQTLDLSAWDDVTTLTINLAGSGAVDDLKFDVCERETEREDSLKLLETSPEPDNLL